MKPLTVLILCSLLLSACASAVDQSAVQTSAAETLNANLSAAQGDAALLTAEAESAALAATNEALATENAGLQTQQAQPTDTPAATSTPQPTATRTQPLATIAPTHEPGIGARFVNSLTCSGTRYAIVRVLNLGNETYQSAIVKLSDDAGNEIRRSDGNNEFLKTAACPGTEGPTLGPGQERFVTVSLGGTTAGATLMIRVTVCTEKGYGGNCWSSVTSFVN